MTKLTYELFSENVFDRLKFEAHLRDIFFLQKK